MTTPIAQGPLDRHVRRLFVGNNEFEYIGVKIAYAEKCALFVPWVKEKYGIVLPNCLLICADIDTYRWAEMLTSFDAEHPELDWPQIDKEYKERVMSPEEQCEYEKLACEHEKWTVEWVMKHKPAKGGFT